MKNPPQTAGSGECQTPGATFAFCFATNHPQDESWGGGRDTHSSGPTVATAQESQRRPDFLVLFFADFLVLLLDFDFLAAIMYHLLSIEGKDSGKHFSQPADVPVYVVDSGISSHPFGPGRRFALCFKATLFQQALIPSGKNIPTSICTCERSSTTDYQPQQ